MTQLKAWAEKDFDGEMPAEAKPADEAKPPVEESPAPPAEKAEGETAPPESEPGNEKQETGLHRGEDGKFKEAEVPAGVQKRIDKAIRAQREAERERDELRARLQNTGSEPAKETPAPAKPQTEAKPDPKDFKSWDEYQESLIDWKVSEREKANARETAQRQQQEQGRQLQQSWSESESGARKAHADYDDVLGSVDRIQVPQQLQLAILRSPEKAELAYALAKSPAELERIVKLPHDEALMELGWIRKEIGRAKEAPKPKPEATKALPKPPASVGGSGPTVPKLDFDKMSMRDFKREIAKLL